MSDGLYWYPAINNKYLFDGDYNKGQMLSSYIRYFLARLQSMFKYDGLPDTIPAKWLEHYLLTNGNALIAMADDGNLYAFTGGLGGDPNVYYIPNNYIVANPYLNLTKTFSIDSGVNNGDAVLIYNDTYSQGLLPMLNRYCSQLVENDITLGIADILARATINASAADDKTKASAELWFKRLREGKLSVIAEKAFIEGLNIREFKDVADSLIPLIEYHQYIKASLYNELGLNSNYNMKRESINSNESQLNDDMLHPLIDDMLRERKEGIDRVNALFGLNIKVDFASAWLENEKEEQMLFEDQPEDDTKIYPGVDVPENSTEDEDGLGLEDLIEDETAEEVPEETPEEVPEEVTEETTEAEIIEDNNKAITEAIEELTDAVKEVADNIEGGEDDGLREDN